MSTLVEARDLSYRVGGRALVEDASLALQLGRVAIAIGPNGAGKSTLLRLLAGELRPSAGGVAYDGAAVAVIPSWRLACKRAVMTQAHRLSFPFAVHEVVRIGLDGAGRKLAAGTRHAVMAASLEAADAAHLAARPFQTLSGGEQQRVQFARVLAQLEAGATVEPRRALFLDEPTASLDLRHQFAVMDAAQAIAARGVAVFAVLHDLSLAARYADDLIVLRGGRIIAAGARDDVLSAELLSGVFDVELEVDRRDGEAPIVIARQPSRRM